MHKAFKQVSAMNVVSAVECLVFRVFSRNFYLDAVMVKIVLLSQDRIDICQDSLLLPILALFESNMASEGILVIIDGPNMHIMHFLNTMDLFESPSNQVNIQVSWSSLQDQDHTLPESQSGSPEDDEGKEVGAKGVKVPQVWPDENDSRCNDNAH